MLAMHAEWLTFPDATSFLLYPVYALQGCPECAQSAGSPPFWILVDFGHLEVQADSWRKGEIEVGFFFELLLLPCTFVKSFSRIC